MKIFQGYSYEIISITIAGLIGLSWLFAGKNIFIFLMSFLFIYFLFKKKNINISQYPFKDIKKNLIDIDYSIALFILVMISFNAIQTNDGYILHDYFHPIYEHGLGHSFSSSLLNPPDLSFYGKNVKWHFLSSQITRMFENIGIEFIQAIYSVTPSILFVLFFILFKQICYDNNKFKLTGLLYFLPLGYFSMLDRLVLFTPSSSISGILILLCYHYFRKKEYIIYLILSIFLCFAKASNFLVLIGFVFLKYVFSKSNQKKNYAYLFLIQLLIFIITFAFYYKDTHVHNNWIAFGFIRNLIIHLDWVYIVLPAFILLYFIKHAFQKTNSRIYNSDLIAISGLIGYLFLFESTEGNHHHFIIASLPFVIISFLKRSYFQGYFFIIMWFIFTLSYYPNNKSRLSEQIVIKITNLNDKRKELINPGSNNYFDLSISTKKLYSKLKVIANTKNSVIWFPVIYESDYNSLITTDDYWPHDGFFRSSISNKQFFLENMKYKSIIMEDDFSLRFALSLIWYENFIEPSEKNKKKYLLLLDVLERKSLNNSNNVPEKENIRRKILKSLIINKKDHYNESYVNNKMSKIYKIFKTSNDNSYTFNDEITHIVLEDGDRLKDYSLAKTWKLIYSDDKSQIWEKSKSINK